MHNAFKNTPSGGRVVLRARAEEGRLLIETEDECGGIPQSESDLFQQFGDRRESHRAGLGLGTLDCEEGGSGARRRYTVWELAGTILGTVRPTVDRGGTFT